MGLILSNLTEVLITATLIVAVISLCLLTWHDYKSMRLPNIYNAFLALSGLAFHVATGWSYLSFISIFIAAFLGAAIFLLSYLLFKWWKNIEAVGMGDVKFAFAAGLWLGIDNIALLLLISSIILLVFGGLYAVVKNKPIKTMKVPFGVTAGPVCTGFIVWNYIFDIYPIFSAF